MSTTTAGTVSIQATITEDIESYQVSSGMWVIGYAARKRTSPTFSLTTADGIDLLGSPTNLAEAVDYLRELDADWRARLAM